MPRKISHNTRLYSLHVICMLPPTRQKHNLLLVQDHNPARSSLAFNPPQFHCKGSRTQRCIFTGGILLSFAVPLVKLLPVLDCKEQFLAGPQNVVITGHPTVSDSIVQQPNCTALHSPRWYVLRQFGVEGQTPLHHAPVPLP